LIKSVIYIDIHISLSGIIAGNLDKYEAPIKDLLDLNILTRNICYFVHIAKRDYGCSCSLDAKHVKVAAWVCPSEELHINPRSRKNQIQIYRMISYRTKNIANMSRR